MMHYETLLPQPRRLPLSTPNSKRPIDPSEETTQWVRGAINGDPESIEWIVQRFTPLLTVQAEYRLRGSIDSVYEASDLVADTWLRSLGKLSEINAKNGRYTPVLVRYLSTVLVNRYNNLLTSHLMTSPLLPMSQNPQGLPEVEASTTDAIQRAAKNENVDVLRRGMAKLGAEHEKLLILRGLEGCSFSDIATIMEISVENARKRYHRALKQMRHILGASIFDEIE